VDHSAIAERAFPDTVVIEVLVNSEVFLGDQVFPNRQDELSARYVLAKRDGRIDAVAIIVLDRHQSTVVLSLEPLLRESMTLKCEGMWTNDWRIIGRGLPDILVRLNPTAPTGASGLVQWVQAEVSRRLTGFTER
jgi:hypothetical protein